MFEAEFTGKLPELINREDYLTSCIFGALKYLPPQEGLFPVIDQSLNYFKKRRLSDYFKSKNIDSNVLKVEYHFWPKSSKYGEPDIVIILEGKMGSFAIPIEVKYFSGKHGEGEEDQLARYFVALNTSERRQTFNDTRIREFLGELLAMVYVTQYEARCDIEQSVKVLEDNGIKNVRDKIFHLQWQDISKIIEKLSLSAKRAYSRSIYEDMIKLLKYKNLLPFSGFLSLPYEIEELMLQIPAFFKTEEKPKYISFCGFSDSPKKISFEHKGKIYYGG